MTARIHTSVLWKGKLPLSFFLAWQAPNYQPSLKHHPKTLIIRVYREGNSEIQLHCDGFVTLKLMKSNPPDIWCYKLKG